MSVSPISTVYKTTATAQDSDQIVTPKKNKQVLGQEDFLKLLAVQFQAQDPMKPMEDTAFIAQMAQFTALDQSSSLVQQMTQLRTNQDIATANSYIGRQVTLDAGDDQTVTGEVSGVEVTEGTPRLIVGDKTYPLSSVLLVEPGTATASTNNSQPVNAGGV
ncbi:MAG TPA: flagellar hook capping FlgD N-terminal domain-containing protein [Opitutus sp.]|nr:flagellar hook capping FlgD N-terminal domain-containing protein [Opitutus sp.]